MPVVADMVPTIVMLHPPTFHLQLQHPLATGRKRLGGDAYRASP
jgi:hypothetical protein